MAVLALLAGARDRGLSRDKLLAYLWPDRDGERARHSLSQILYALRGDLGDDALATSGETLRLNPAIVGADVWDFEDALARGDHDAAIAAYGGPFLDGFFLSDAPEFERWCDGERDRLAQAFAGALERAARAATAAGDRGASAAYWRRRAGVEPLNGRVAVSLMQALVDAGDVAGALQHARVHAMLRQQELDAAPDPSVEQFAARLRESPPPAVPAAASALPSTAASPQPTPSAGRGRASSWRSWLRRAPRVRLSARGAIAAATGLAALLLAAGAVFARRDHGPATSLSIVVGSVRSPDSVLGLAVREALRAELETDRAIHVLTEMQLRETLELMRRPLDAPLDAASALEIAQRRGAPLVIVASAAPLGTGVQLVADLLDAGSGSTVATVTERPESAEDVVPAVTRLATAIRRHVAGARVEGSPAPLPAVTTSSLAALRDFALARQAAQRLDRQGAIDLLEAALAHDSLFALAHYLVGDLLWYVDQQRHSEVHLNAALRMADRLPPRERLVVRARHEQLVRDRPDSALAYWQQLRAAYPDEPLAYEGMIWAYLALERQAELLAAVDAALAHDPASRFALRMRYVTRLQAGDTAGALASAWGASDLLPEAVLETRLGIEQRQRNWPRALAILDSARPPLPDGRPNPRAAATRQLLLLAVGRVDDARREMETIVERRQAQYPHRALLFQAHAESRDPRRRDDARALTRRALALIRESDIYAPAVARLTELAVTAAARLRDTATIADARRLVLERDAGRGLRSYAIVLTTIDAAAAYARGDWRAAADLARGTRPARFHGRALADVMLLEADARAALGELESARELRRSAAERDLPWAAFPNH